MVENIFLAVWGIAVGMLIAAYIRELFLLAKPLDTPRPDWLPYDDPDDDLDATGGWRRTGTPLQSYFGTEIDPFDNDPYHDLDDMTGGSWTDADLDDEFEEDFFDDNEEDDDV